MKRARALGLVLLAALACPLSVTAQKISPGVFPKLGCDPFRDFAPVTMLAITSGAESDKWARVIRQANIRPEQQ